jgi:hypothetical protein
MEEKPVLVLVKELEKGTCDGCTFRTGSVGCSSPGYKCTADTVYMMPRAALHYKLTGEINHAWNQHSQPPKPGVI